jgi:hypothetical protein
VPETERVRAGSRKTESVRAHLAEATESGSGISGHPWILLRGKTPSNKRARPEGAWAFLGRGQRSPGREWSNPMHHSGPAAEAPDRRRCRSLGNPPELWGRAGVPCNPSATSAPSGFSRLAGSGRQPCRICHDCSVSELGPPL